MTQEDIIRMAREAGCHEASHPMNPWSVPQETLERFFRLAYEAGASAEREACADICDQHASIEGIAQRCAAEIRARNK
jgi:hypothetical protein